MAPCSTAGCPAVFSYPQTRAPHSHKRVHWAVQLQSLILHRTQPLLEPSTYRQTRAYSSRQTMALASLSYRLLSQLRSRSLSVYRLRDPLGTCTHSAMDPTATNSMHRRMMAVVGRISRAAKASVLLMRASWRAAATRSVRCMWDRVLDAVSTMRLGL